MKSTGQYADASSVLAMAYSENIELQINTKTEKFRPARKDPETGRYKPVPRKDLPAELTLALEENSDAVFKILTYAKAREELEKKCRDLGPPVASEVGLDFFNEIADNDLGNEAFDTMTRGQYLQAMGEAFRKARNAATKAAREDKKGSVTHLDDRRKGA